MSVLPKARIDYDAARDLLLSLFTLAEEDYRDSRPVRVDDAAAKAADTLFSSATQSYREVLLGCALARLCNAAVDIRLPYINQGDRAFNGRTLDEQVVNPFLHDRRIPSSKGPYLATFRRNVQFTQETARGVRDKAGYQALLNLLTEIETAGSEDTPRDLVRYLLYRFMLCVMLRISRSPELLA